MSGAWLTYRPSRCAECGWAGRLEWWAPCPSCGANGTTPGMPVPQAIALPLLDAGPALYAEEAGGAQAAWFDDPDAVRVIRRPARTAAATAAKQRASRAALEHAAAMRADNMAWKAIGAELEYDPEYLRKAVKRL